MSEELVCKLETKISELENKVKQNSDAVGTLVVSIENQSIEKTRIQNETTFLSGAIQMAKAMISELKPSNPEMPFTIEGLEECK